MAINVYTGLMGSGKSYEIMLNVVLPAMLAGRRVVTNIDGVDHDRICDYLAAKNPKHSGGFGTIVHVTDEMISQPGFFPDESKVESVVLPGDLVVIDEAWRHWSHGKSLSPEHQQFFRMHRHYTDPDTGVSCDLALVFQSISDVNRSLRAVIEMNFMTTKLKTIGMKGSYRIEFWQGGKQTKAAFVGYRVTRYDDSIFPLYKSYSGPGGTEVAIDARQNVLNNPKLWLGVGVMLLVFVCSGWFLWSFLHPSAPDSVLPSVSQPSKSDTAAVVASSVPAKPATTSSIDRRIGGVVVLPSGRFVVVVDRLGNLSFDSAHSYVGKGIFLVGDHLGERISAAPFVR